jgi:hypothetical protein
MIYWRGNYKKIYKTAIKRYYDNELNLLTSGLYYKQVTIVIYDCNDIGLYYKTRDYGN